MGKNVVSKELAKPYKGKPYDKIIELGNYRQEVILICFGSWQDYSFVLDY